MALKSGRRYVTVSVSGYDSQVCVLHVFTAHLKVDQPHSRCPGARQPRVPTPRDSAGLDGAFGPSAS